MAGSNPNIDDAADAPAVAVLQIVDDRLAVSITCISLVASLADAAVQPTKQRSLAAAVHVNQHQPAYCTYTSTSIMSLPTLAWFNLATDAQLIHKHCMGKQSEGRAMPPVNMPVEHDQAVGMSLQAVSGRGLLTWLHALHTHLHHCFEGFSEVLCSFVVSVHVRGAAYLQGTCSSSRKCASGSISQSCAC